MEEMRIRKELLIIEDTLMEGGEKTKSFHRKAAAVAVIKNPYAGKYVKDLSLLINFGEKLGERLAKRVVGALGVESQKVKGYGKGAIIGSEGEIEHGAALIHPKFGKPVRAAVSGGKSIIPSTKKRGGPGTRIDVPVVHKDDIWSMPYLDAMEVTVGDSPAPDEIVVVLVMTNAMRAQSRLGGEEEDEIQRAARVGGSD